MIPNCQHIDPVTCDPIEGATHPGVPHATWSPTRGQFPRGAYVLPFLPADGIIRVVGTDGRCCAYRIRDAHRCDDGWQIGGGTWGSWPSFTLGPVEEL